MSRSASAAKRKSWKQTAATRHKGSSGSRRNTLLGFSLLSAVLLAIFVYMILSPKDEPRTYFVQLPILKYDRLVQPIEYVGNDYAPLLPLPQASQAILHTRSIDILQTADSVGELPSLFTTDKVRPKDVLILFVSAHGISADGKAYIACSDFLRESPTGMAGIYPLANFLDHIDQCQASAKLIVFDTGRLQYDPRIGLLVNEFPLLLAEEMKKHADPKLFVLCGTGMMQYPNVLHDQRRTLFSSLVIEGLTGAADSWEMNQVKEPDDKVTLAELYKFVVDRMADYYPPESGVAQTAYLMQGGTGVLQDFSEIEKHDAFLISLLDIRKAERAEQEAREAEAAKKAAAESASARRRSALPNRSLAGQMWGRSGGPLALQQAGTPAAGDPAPTAPPAEAATANTPPATPAAPATGTAPQPAAAAVPAASPVGAAPAEQAADQKSPEDDRLRAALSEAWSQRDRLESRGIGKGWSPVDFAPHYWRLMNERLLDCERRYLAGDDYELENLATELEGEVSGLKKLAGLINSNSASRDLGKKSFVSDHLLAAWSNFLASSALKASYENPEDSARALKQARWDYHDHVNRAVYYVRWHDRNTFSMADSAPGTQEIADLLRSLASLQDLLAGGSAAASLSGGELESRLQPIQNISGQLDDIIAEQLRQALEAWDTPTGQRRLYDLLASPLLTSGDRSRAISQMMRSDRKPPHRSDFASHTKIPRLNVSAAQWRALSDRLLLQTLILKLADEQLYKVVDQQLLLIEDSQPSGDKETATLLATYRNLGSRFSQFYRETLPDNIITGGGATATDTAALAAARSSLRLLDARDAERAGVPAFPLLLPLDTNTGPQRAQVQVALDLKRLQLRIDPANPEPLKLPIIYTGENSSVATLRLTFPESSIGVRSALDGRELASGKEFTVPLFEANRRLVGELDLEIWAKADTSTASVESNLDIEVEVIDRTTKEKAKSDPLKIICLLPNKNFIELLVQRSGAPEPHEDDEGAISLRPFPNRETPYLMWLQNHSGVPKEVTVKLLAIPETRAATWAPGRLFGRGGRRFHQIDNEVFVPGRNFQVVNSSVKVLATTKPFSLPADIRAETPIPFQVPGSEPAEGAAAPPPVPEKDPDGDDISHGLAMVIADAANPRDIWVKWIELRPQSPVEYMSAEVTYDATLQQIQVAVRPRTDDPGGDGILDLIPLNVSKDPIDVYWDVDASELAELGATKYGEFTGVNPRQPVELHVNGVEDDGKKREVWLTIDGYPRAMAYTIVCAAPLPGQARRTGTELRQSVAQIRLKSLSMPSEAYPKMFFYTPGGDPIGSLSVMAKDRQKTAIFLDENQAAYFPSAKQTAPVDFQEILAHVEVDAPAIAFDNSDLGADVIEVGIEGDQLRFYSDRKIETRLLKITPDGQLRLKTKVSDYTNIPVKTRAYSHQRTDFVARLKINNDVKDGVKTHPVFFDDHPPKLVNLGREGNQSLPVPLEQGITVSVEATALAGIDRVEFAIDLTGEGDWSKLEPLADRTDGLLRFDNKFAALLPTEDLVPGKRYNVLVRAFDRIGLYPSETQKLAFTTAKPKEAKPGNQPPTVVFGTVGGIVKTGSYTFRRGEATVKLEGGGEPPQSVECDSNGRFLFENVKVGPQYKLSAEGRLQYDRYGEVEGVVATPPKEEPRPYTLDLTRDTRDEDLDPRNAR